MKRWRVGNLYLSPTRSGVCDTQPISLTRGYKTLTTCLAAALTPARSCVSPNSILLSIPSVTDRMLISSLASSSLFTLFCKNSSLTRHCFTHGLLRVGGRQCLSKVCYESQHPAIIHRKYPLTRLILRTEHLRMLHAGPTLLAASLSLRYHIVGGRKFVRSVVRECIACR